MEKIYEFKKGDEINVNSSEGKIINEFDFDDYDTIGYDVRHSFILIKRDFTITITITINHE